MLEKDAVNVLSGSAYGTHSLVIYPTLRFKSLLHKIYQTQIEDKNESIKFLPFYETENSVRTILSNSDVEIDVDKIENREKTLILHDSLEIYLDQTSPESLRDDHLDLVEHAIAMKTKGVSILGDMGAFFFKKQIQNLLNYERILPKEFDANLKGICLYHQNDFNNLYDNTKQKLIDYHQIAMKI